MRRLVPRSAAALLILTLQTAARAEPPPAAPAPPPPTAPAPPPPTVPAPPRPAPAYAEARRAFKEERYRDAALGFEAADRERPDAVALYTAAQAWELAAELARA